MPALSRDYEAHHCPLIGPDIGPAISSGKGGIGAGPVGPLERVFFGGHVNHPKLSGPPFWNFLKKNNGFWEVLFVDF